MVDEPLNYMIKPTRNAILLLTARFETTAIATGKKVVLIDGAFVRLEPSFQFERPHEGYGRMIMVKATRVEDGTVIGTLSRVCADEVHCNAISVGGVTVPAEFRRKGVATVLYDYVEEIAKRCNATLVMSDLTSDDAKAFWAARRARNS